MSDALSPPSPHIGYSGRWGFGGVPPVASSHRKLQQGICRCRDNFDNRLLWADRHLRLPSGARKEAACCRNYPGIMKPLAGMSTDSGPHMNTYKSMSHIWLMPHMTRDGLPADSYFVCHAGFEHVYVGAFNSA